MCFFRKYQIPTACIVSTWRLKPFEESFISKGLEANITFLPLDTCSAVNLIIKSKPVNWKPKTSGYRFLSTNTTFTIIIVYLKINYIQALLNYTLNIFILKEKMVYKLMLAKNAGTSKILGIFK